MRCPICDFCEDQELSIYGLSVGYLPDGTRNRIDHRSGLCFFCAPNPMWDHNEAILEGEVPLMDMEWDLT